MDSREQFEAAMTAVLVAEGYKQESTPSILAHNGREYQTIRIEGAWIGWQASREALCVKLPDGNKYHFGSTEDDAKQRLYDAGENTMLKDVKDALDEQGVRYE